MIGLRAALQAAFGRPRPVSERIAFHAPLLAGLDDLASESHIALRQLHQEQPHLFPNFHARIGDRAVSA